MNGHVPGQNDQEKAGDHGQPRSRKNHYLDSHVGGLNSNFGFMSLRYQVFVPGETATNHPYNQCYCNTPQDLSPGGDKSQQNSIHKILLSIILCHIFPLLSCNITYSQNSTNCANKYCDTNHSCSDDQYIFHFAS